MTQSAPSELVHDILRPLAHPLDAFFAPHSVAVVGATETAGSVGRTLMANLLASPLNGTVYPVNPKRPTVLGVQAYPSISALPTVVDLAVLVTPAPAVPGLVAECVTAGIKAAIVISAGFKETGPEGAALERQIAAHLHGSSLRLIGPNCLGIMCPRRPQRDLRRRHGSARQSRPHQPERRHPDGHPRLELSGKRRL